jgi:hypothetical protein
MKKQILQWIVVATVGFSSFIGPLHAEDFEPVFGSEDETQRPLPPEALSAVRVHVKTTQYSDCAAGQFVGSAVNLTGRGQSNDWIAKTEDGCAWGLRRWRYGFLSESRTAIASCCSAVAKW